MLKLSEIIQKFETVIPLSYQESYDRSGLQVGSKKQKIKKILFAYDACHEVLRFAAKNRFDLIVTHHPLTLSDYKNINLDTYEGETLRLAIKNNIAIYSAHTNHDASLKSLNRHYAEKLGLTNLNALKPSQKKLYLKLVTFVPVSHTERVMQALFQAGAGHIGNYANCSFRTIGTGTFKGTQDTHPFIGKPGTLEEANENRLEVILTLEKKQAVVSALLKSHPYEEVAYDLIPLENTSSYAIGSGLYGDMEKTISVNSLIPKIKKIFKIKKLRLSAHRSKKIKRIGLCTGSGASLLPSAIAANVDLFITGDVKYHNAVDALRADVALIDVGHFHSEIKSVTLLKNMFTDLFGNQFKLAEYNKLKDAFVDL